VIVDYSRYVRVDRDNVAESVIVVYEVSEAKFVSVEGGTVVETAIVE